MKFPKICYEISITSKSEPQNFCQIWAFCVIFSNMESGFMSYYDKFHLVELH